jgi:hypothetical protein
MEDINALTKILDETFKETCAAVEAVQKPSQPTAVLKVQDPFVAVVFGSEAHPDTESVNAQTRVIRVVLPEQVRIWQLRAELDTLEKKSKFNSNQFVTGQIAQGLSVMRRDLNAFVKSPEHATEDLGNPTIRYELDHDTECKLREIACEVFRRTRREIRMSRLVNLALAAVAVSG